MDMSFDILDLDISSKCYTFIIFYEQFMIEIE